MPRGMSSARIERLNTIMWLFNQNRYYTSKELRVKLECKVRTLQRDFQLLRKSFGVIIENENGSYKCSDKGVFK